MQNISLKAKRVVAKLFANYTSKSNNIRIVLTGGYNRNHHNYLQWFRMKRKGNDQTWVQ